MQLFYIPEIKGDFCTMDESESGHCIRVLRMNSGDLIKFVDGKGGFYEGVISKPDARACVVKIIDRQKDFEKKNYRLHMAVSLLGNPARFEWLIEKCVETGVDEITPLICANTEKTTVRAERINKIIISAMKQSLKAFRPLLNNPVDFNDFILKEHQATKMIAHCDHSYSRADISEIYDKGTEAVILIGPEGDFSKQEISGALSRGFCSVHLGNSRFRSETAAVASCLAVYFINR